MNKPHRTYAPRGVLTEKPIGLRFSPEEREKIERLANKENRSLASMSRILAIEAVNAREQEHCQPV